MCDSHGNLHICGANETAAAWEPTNQMIKRWTGRGKRRVPVGCCNRWVQPRHTECRFVTAFGGWIAEHEFRCKPDKGCNANPGYKRTAHLRDLYPDY